MVAHAEADSVPLNVPGPAVASTIRLTAQVTHVVNAATDGSGRFRKSGRECQPPMLLRPRLTCLSSSDRMRARRSWFIAPASGTRNRPMTVGNACVTSSSIELLDQQSVTETANPASLVSLYLLFMSLAV